ncbi:MAG: hypothetical protein KF768_00330 [Phycisphaeraceae bacterium]|nr:hypothetical protein [Phycisphaeraceae bacterium]
MPTISADKARAICSPAEYKLVRESAPQNIAGLSAAELRGAVARARKLRDKQRDIAQRQRREYRGKADPRKMGGRGNPATNNANTLLKLDLFQLALDRFQARLDKVESGAADSLAKKNKRKGKAAKTAMAKKAAGRTAKGGTAASANGAVASKNSNTPKPAKSIKKKASPKLAKAGKAKTLALSSRAGSLTGGVETTSARLAARTSALLAVSEHSAPSRHANILANTANARIRGHARGAHRRAQARRDAVQRVGRDPGVKPGRKEP